MIGILCFPLPLASIRKLSLESPLIISHMSGWDSRQILQYMIL
jgi:hypothetical protein